MKNSIGAFPNKSTTVFNQLSDLVLGQQFGFRNQENNNQTQILMTMMMMMENNFSKYFDVLLMVQSDAHNDDDANPIKFNVLMFVEEKVLLMMDITDDDLLKTIKKTEDIVVAAINNQTANEISKKVTKAMINMNIPLLKSGYILMIAGKRQSMMEMMTMNVDGARSVTNDNNLDMIRKQTLMAILIVVFNIDHDDSKKMMMMMNENSMTMMTSIVQNMNSNNKKLTNNCKIEINTDNINFSYYCDENDDDDDDYVSVFLSQKLDITMQTTGSVTKSMMKNMNQLQSHLIQSFIVNENDDEKIDDDDDEIDILTKTTSTTSQSNTNKSEYAFERTLNNFNDDDANVATIKIKITSSKLMMMESTTKLFSLIQCWLRGDSDKMTKTNVQEKKAETAKQQKQSKDEDDDEYTSSNDDDDAGYNQIISNEMQLESLLQSFKESDQQSGIVSNNSCNTITKLIISNDDDGEAMMEMMMTIEHSKENGGNKSSNTMQPEDAGVGDQPTNISELIFSHINDKNDTLIVINADNTVNITCDFNYLNYKIKRKINDQIHKDNASVKDYKSCYNNTTTTTTNEVESNTTTNNKNTSSLADKMQTTQRHHTIDEMIECQRRENELLKQSGRRLRLCGGGEGSLSGASGWGSPPSNTSSNNNNNNSNNNNNNQNAGQWGATAQQTPQQNWNQAAQQAVPPSQSQQVQQNPVAPGQPQQGQAQNPNQKPLTPGGPSGGWNQPPQAQVQQQQQPPIVPQQVPGGNGAPGIVGGGTSTVAAKNQLEQLNSMREALFAQDGWGCQNVNQDTNWDVPGSPEPGPRGTGDQAVTAQWKAQNFNNGTELWEANLRNGGQPAPQPVQKTSWHTPTTNIGGTWGEEDDSGNEPNVWGGGGGGGNQNQQAPGWNQGAGAAAGAAGGAAMWPATPGVGGGNANIPKKESEWGGSGPGATSGWGDPRGSVNPSAGPMDMRDPRAPGSVDMRIVDSRVEPMLGNPRGVTGRLNGSTDMWHQGGMGAHGGQVPNMNKVVGPGAAAVSNPQWPGSQVGGPKDIDMNKPAGWGDSSPPSARRPMNVDSDGTSLWGSRGQSTDNWKGNQDPRNNFAGRNPIGVGNNSGPVFPPSRLPNAGMKPDGNAWGGIHQGNRNAWDDPHTPNWEDKPHLGAGGGIAPWNDGSNANPMWNKNKPSWPDNNEITNEWPQQNKLGNVSSEIIRSSKQFRILVETGFKKDDAEIALRTTNMNPEEAMELLQQQQRNNSGIDAWHHGAAGGAFDHSAFSGNRYPGPQNMPFPPNNPKLPNSSGAGGPGGVNLGGLNNLPMQINKHLPHQAGTPAFTQQAAAASQGGAGGQPSAHHLRNLVQQIQKAVQAGYLNHQILNQPLAPQTLQLLNNLLNTIQQLQYTQQSIQRNGGVNSIQHQMTIQKQKQTISALQSQIAQQQSLYIKSQAAGGGGGSGGIGGGNDFIRQNSASNMGMGVGNHNDPIASLETNLAGLGLKQEPTSPYPTNTTSQQSRLNQWKLPPTSDNKLGEPDFSRAPGTTSKQSLPPTTPTSISSIGIHNEAGTWSTGRNDAGGWPDSSIEQENKDWPASNQSPAFTDLVPEFQPGKPWKGTQKNIEDDPSITPGSVARSLSISAAKESDLFGSNTAKTSPNEILSSSTWSFNPSSTTQQNFSSTMPKLGADGSKTNSWSDSTSDLWAAPSAIGKTTAGPPPGLGSSKNGSTPAATSEANDWIGGWNASNTTNSSGNGTWFSTWLLLKNLTAQIDGSTLRTLCVQHGPLQHFHLYLNHGLALCKYNTREEASKAQQALNNCVLSNTTICAESPSESEVQNILQHLGVPSGSQGNGGNGNGASSAAGTNSSTWRPPSQQGPARTAGSDSTWASSSEWSTTNSAINW